MKQAASGVVGRSPCCGAPIIGVVRKLRSHANDKLWGQVGRCRKCNELVGWDGKGADE